MGEVYLAEDTKLSRNIALKVLPQELAASPDRRERFHREARAVAALNHPNIVTLHSVEEADGVLFLTLEHVEGETLRDKIDRGPLPVDEVFTHRGPDRRRALESPRRGHPSPGSEASQRHGHRRRAGEAPRLRTRQVSRARRDRSRRRDHGPGDEPGHDPRDRRIHGAGAGSRKGRRRAGRPLRSRCRALRDDDGEEPVSRRYPGGVLRFAPSRCAGVAVGGEPGSPHRSRPRRRAGDGEGPRSPVSPRLRSSFPICKGSRRRNRPARSVYRSPSFRSAI